MNRNLLSKLKERLQPTLDPEAPTGVLSDAQHEIVYALFQVLAADEGFPREQVRRHVDARTRAEPGYLREYAAAVALLEAATARRHPGRAFTALSAEARDAVLRSILRPYPSARREPAWRRRLKLTSENLDVARGATIGGRPARRFRLHVVRDLLVYYYTTAAGWAVVGYDAFPGRSRAELEPCEVRSVSIERGRILLALSDGSVEELAPQAVRVEGDDGLSILVKAGRQRASFSRAALLSLGEHLDEEGGALVLRVGDRTHEIAR
ncbi:hypothetical protein WME76_12855 [Sorangium sp. So ce119]|uniref:hypothetical protein n=1 Tax=Sorangium sp. So ce119 TaxID=3133279 RepID=UPI003F5E5F23